MLKRQLKRPSKPMPEYKILPIGTWHFIAAVMLMIFCIVSMTISISFLLDLDSNTQNTAFIELGMGWTFCIILTHLSFMVTRGSVFCYGLLLKYNRICMSVLVVGNIMALISGDVSTAIFAAVGLALGLLAHQIYLSEKYLKFLEFQEVAWGHYRWNRRKK